MREHAHARMSLYGSAGGRKYLNAAERRRFIKAAQHARPDVQLFCLVLSLSGGRISEILALTPAAIDLDSGVANIITLKRRRAGVVRQVPLPRSVLGKLDRNFHLRHRQRDPNAASRRIWKWSRTTAWRRVKEVMVAAEISGLAAMPKGLRHGFGVNATGNLVPIHLVQRWLGHASPKTTAIYCDVCGPEERALAARMWANSIKRPSQR
jgi:integrase/recombinase XerD